MSDLQSRKDGAAKTQHLGYRTVNAYTQEPSIQQILTIVLFVVEVILHNVFITSAIARQDSSILWIMLAITYILLAIIIVDYLYLTCTDPVDDMVLGANNNYQQSETKHCKEGCEKLVHRSSYHCHTCNRCVVKFDHHCKYLNNCIGGKNYHNFFRLLVVVTIFCLFIIGSAIWIFAFAKNDESFDSKILSKWGVIATLIYTIIVMISVDTLLCFHCYLVFKLQKTTLQYLEDKTHDNGDTSKQVIDN